MRPFKARIRSRSGRGSGSREKAIRLLRIIWLLQKETCTVEELAERFGVSRRTVYRDLELIEAAGLPVVTRGGGQGYRLMAQRPAAFGDSSDRRLS